MGTIMNKAAIDEAMKESRRVVRASESASVRRHTAEVRAAQAALAAAIEADIEAEELAMRSEFEVLTDFADADEDFVDAETGESLFAGFSVRG